MSAPELSYILDDPSKQYASEIGDARSLVQLREILADWAQFAPDAIECAQAMTEEEWPGFIAGLLKERLKEFAGEDWAARYSAILLPEKMFKASMIAMQANAPWGCAFIRMEEVASDS